LYLIEATLARVTSETIGNGRSQDLEHLGSCLCILYDKLVVEAEVKANLDECVIVRGGLIAIGTRGCDGLRQT
jgi:hypothetical protein